MRIYTCFNGHHPHILNTQSTDKKILACPACEVATNQHGKLQEAIAEWNYGGSQLWKAYHNTLRARFLRWWRGRSQ